MWWVCCLVVVLVSECDAGQCPLSGFVVCLPGALDEGRRQRRATRTSLSGLPWLSRHLSHPAAGCHKQSSEGVEGVKRDDPCVRQARDRALVALAVWPVPRQRQEQRKRQRHRQSPPVWRCALCETLPCIATHHTAQSRALIAPDPTRSDHLRDCKMCT
jgi:hypothetical protein